MRQVSVEGETSRLKNINTGIRMMTKWRLDYYFGKSLSQPDT